MAEQTNVASSPGRAVSFFRPFFKILGSCSAGGATPGIKKIQGKNRCDCYRDLFVHALALKAPKRKLVVKSPVPFAFFF